MTWLSKYSFYLVLLLLGAGSLYVIWNYLGLMFLALILVIVFEPLFEQLKRKTKREGVAALLTTLIVLGVLIIPMGLLVGLAVQQAHVLIISISSQVAWNQLQQSELLIWLQHQVPDVGKALGGLLEAQQGQLTTLIGSLAQNLGQVVTKGIIPIVAGTVQAIANSIIFIILLAYLFPIKKKLFKVLADLSPLDKKHTARFIRRFEVVIRATVKSTLFVGLVQGVLGAVMLTILKVPGAAVWGLMMGLAAFIPLGSGIVWWPIGIILILTGQWISGLIWLGYGLLVISTVDNVVRSKVLGAGESALPELVTLLAVLGGVQAFGFVGFMLGPVIVAMFITALQVYLEEKVLQQK